MSENNENAPRMTFDSSRAVVSTSHALRLGFPRVSPKVIFWAGDTILSIEPAKNEAHAKNLLAQVQKQHQTITVSMTFAEPKVSAKELRGSTGRPKPYSIAKEKTGKV